MNKQNIMYILTLILGVSACKSSDVEYKYPKSYGERKRQERGSLIAGDDDSIFLSGGKANSKNSAISTNTYVWRAALDVISFMPIASSDSAGGMIVTDWYSDSKSPNEKFKFNIIISSNSLEATALKVNGFKQIKDAKGEWRNAKISDDVTKDLERKILTLARKMKTSSM